MNYPFPTAANSPAAIYSLAALLLVLGFVPLIRILTRSPTPNRLDQRFGVGATDRFLAGGCAAIAAGLLLILPSLLPDPRDRATAMMLAFDAMIIAVHIVWCIAVSRDSVRLTARLSEIAVPYGVGLLVASVLLVPVTEAREAARRTQCRGHLKQIGLALHNYHGTYSQFPDLASVDGLPPRSWRVELLPFLDHAALRQQYVDADAWDAASNRPVSREWMLIYRCPSHEFEEVADQPKFAAYSGVRGSNTLFPDGRGLPIRKVTDGTSNTIAIVEACGRPVIWTAPHDIDLAQQRVGVNLPGEQPGRSGSAISSYHPRGANVAFADGSVRWVSQDIDPKLLQALLSVNGGETVGDF